jgi:DNA-binding beta-propeller fold protein YncE
VRAARSLARRLSRSGLRGEGPAAQTNHSCLRRPASLAALTFVCATALLALTAPSALAARGHEFDPNLTLGKPCTEAVCGPEELKEPTAVAVNETSGEIYVLDQGNDRVVRFSSSGAVLGEFNGSGEVPGEGAAAGSLGNPGEVETGRFEFPTGQTPPEPQNGALAVDNSCHLKEVETGTPLSVAECESFDPSDGDVYVIDPGFEHPGEHLVIDKFGPTGEYVGQITEGKMSTSELAPVERFSVGGSLNGLAVDRSGSPLLLIGIGHAFVNRYTDARSSAFVSSVEVRAFFGDLPLPGFADDPAGGFYVRHGNPGAPEDNRIAKVDPTGAVLDPELDPEPSTSVTVDQTTDRPYVCNTASVAGFDPQGTLIERLGAEGGQHLLAECAGIGVDSLLGTLYVADRAAGRVVVFGPQQPGVPTIKPGSESASQATSSSARLQAEISPRSEPNEGPTSYRVEFGPCTSAGSCASSPYPFLTDGPTDLAPDFEFHPVAIELTGLEPGTTFHYKFVGSNDSGEGEGEESIFATQTAGLFSLLDSRQWELVSPPQKLGARILPISETGIVQASADGTGVTYLASTPAESEPAGYSNEQQILSIRGATGWSTHDLATPHIATTGLSNGPGQEYRFFDSQLTQGVLQPFGQFDPALSPEASESTAILHALGSSCQASCYRPLVTGKEGLANVPAGTHFGEAARCTPPSTSGILETVCGPEVIGATDDLAHLVLRSAVPLVNGAGNEHEQLYEWSAGHLTQVSILPDGDPNTEGNWLGGGFLTRRAISTDGSRVVWTANRAGAPLALYLRADASASRSASGACDEAGRACTIQLDEGCATCESGGGEFQVASTDGSRVFFTDTRALTEGSGASPSGHQADLYECRIVELSPGHLSCDLADLTPESGGEAADVQGNVLGASEDGSYLYFVADGVLAGNRVDNRAGLEESAQAGQPNLYLSHEGTITYVTTLAAVDDHDWSQVLADGSASQPTRASTGGRYLALMSARSLTGYDNRDVASGQPVAEVYLYDAVTGRLSCASCDPTGARPVGIEYRKLEPNNGGLVGGPRGIWRETDLVAANMPGSAAFENNHGGHQSRYLSDSGRLFFNTINPLVPQDSNGNQDVYEYEPPQGPGQPASNTCTTASPTYSPTSQGCVNLISAGTSSDESAFLDASENGDDVFFLTSSKLVPQDTDAALDVYDAHVCSAEVPCLPEPAAAPEPCKGEACQSSPARAAEASPSTQTFSGPGNVSECRKGQVRKGGKCVKKQQKKAKKQKKKHHKKGHGKKHSRTAGKSQGGNR